MGRQRVVDHVAHRQRIEATIQHRVTVEVEQGALASQQITPVFLWVQFGNLALEQRRLRLQVLALLPLVTLQLALGGGKGVAE